MKSRDKDQEIILEVFGAKWWLIKAQELDPGAERGLCRGLEA